MSVLPKDELLFQMISDIRDACSQAVTLTALVVMMILGCSSHPKGPPANVMRDNSGGEDGNSVREILFAALLEREVHLRSAALLYVEPENVEIVRRLLGKKSATRVKSQARALRLSSGILVDKDGDRSGCMIGLREVVRTGDAAVGTAYFYSDALVMYDFDLRKQDGVWQISHTVGPIIFN